MNYYIAVFMPFTAGGYGVFFPGLPEAFTYGESLGECVEAATEVLAMTIEEYTKARKPIPSPPTHEEAKLYATAKAQEKGCAEADPILQLIPAPDMDMTPVRISVSIAKSALEALDRKAAQAGLTRSGFIAKAAQAYSI